MKFRGMSSKSPSYFEDADAAMAWVRGRAAKQGVSEDERLTSPDLVL